MGIAATPAKLKSGEWGARVTSPVSVGDTVTITTKSGKSWDATVTRVVWKGDGVSLCATGGGDRPKSGGRRTGCSCGSREDAHGCLIPSPNNCWQCEHDA